MPPGAKTATVTGATGFVAAELIRQLLRRGYSVKATVRGATDDARLAPLLRAADGAPGSLQLLQVRSLLSRSPELDAAIAGSTYVFHVASPFRFDGDPQKDVIEPAIEGTRAVLTAAAAASPRPARVIVTSSVCAIHDQHQKHVPLAGRDGKYSEEDWNTASTPEAEPYWVSKIEAEKLAWELASELGLDVVTILPNFVLGPVAGPLGGSGVSVGFLKDFLEAPGGKVPEGAWTICDVRDVAAAHVAAAENPDAAGRYIVSQPGSIDARFVTDALKGALPGAAALPDGPRTATKETIDASKVRTQLGIELHPAAQTIADGAASLLEHGLAAPAWAAKGAAAKVPAAAF